MFPSKVVMAVGTTNESTRQYSPRVGITWLHTSPKSAPPDEVFKKLWLDDLEALASLPPSQSGRLCCWEGKEQFPLFSNAPKGDQNNKASVLHYTQLLTSLTDQRTIIDSIIDHSQLKQTTN
jgi:hypothetical protein